MPVDGGVRLVSKKDISICEKADSNHSKIDDSRKGGSTGSKGGLFSGEEHWGFQLGDAMKLRVKFAE